MLPAKGLLSTAFGKPRAYHVARINEWASHSGNRRELFASIGPSVVGYHGIGLKARHPETTRGFALSFSHVLQGILLLTEDRTQLERREAERRHGSLLVDLDNSELMRLTFRDDKFTRIIRESIPLLTLEHFGYAPTYNYSRRTDNEKLFTA